ATASRGGALPVLAGIRTELTGDELTLTGHDLELTITVAVRDGVRGERDGVAILPARLVSDVVKALPPGAVEVEVDGDQARITASRSEFTLRVFPVDEFPRLPEPTGDAVTLDAAELAGALRQVVPAASSDDARPILTGVLVTAEAGGLRLVATDSYRLAVRDLPGQSILAEGQSVLVPSRALNDLTKVLGGVGELTLMLGERDATVVAGDVRPPMMVTERSFLGHRGLSPSSRPSRRRVSREALPGGVRRGKLRAREVTPVRLALSSDGLELVGVIEDVGQAHESLEAKYE